MSKIEWTNTTWNPLRGCRRVSPGCKHCYAERQAARPILSGPGKPYEGLVQISLAPQLRGRADPHGPPQPQFMPPRWTGKTAGPDHLDVPLRWRKGRRVFVCSMSDLFYEGHTDEQIAAVFGVMAAAPQHTFQILTKRAERMARWFEWQASRPLIPRITDCIDHAMRVGAMVPVTEEVRQRIVRNEWPLPNVWIGVSAEDQQRADERIPHLLRVPAAVRWVSYEPALGPVDFDRWLDWPWWCERCRVAPERHAETHLSCHDEGAVVRRGLDWIVVGGESGPGARPFDVAWARSAVAQCKAAVVPVFVKQMGARPHEQINRGGIGDGDGDWDYGWLRLRDRKGGDLSEWPADLRIREFPQVHP